MEAQNVAVVTGGSSGIGYETSLMLARNGFLTYATMRNLNKSENIKSIAAKENLPPYSQIMQKMAAGLEAMFKNSSSADVVAKVVLRAVTSENPNSKYLAGKDAEMLMEAKKSMSEEEFDKMMKQNLMGGIQHESK